MLTVGLLLKMKMKLSLDKTVNFLTLRNNTWTLFSHKSCYNVIMHQGGSYFLLLTLFYKLSRMWIVSSICDLLLIYIYPRTCATSPLNLLTRGSPSMRILGPTARAIVSLQESSWIVIIHLSGELTRWCTLSTTSCFTLTRILSFKIIITFVWHHLWCCSTSRAMSALDSLDFSQAGASVVVLDHIITSVFLQLARLHLTGILNIRTWY